MKMGTGVDPTMDRKIPTTLWKTQLLKLVSEAPKALCVECTELGYQRFPSSSSTSGDDSSDQSIGSAGSVTGTSDFGVSIGVNIIGSNGSSGGVNTNGQLTNGTANHRRKNEILEDDDEKSLADMVSSLAALELEMANSLSITLNSSNSNSNSNSSEHSHSPSPHPPSIHVEAEERDRNGKGDPVVVMRRDLQNLQDTDRCSPSSGSGSGSSHHLHRHHQLHHNNSSSAVNLSVHQGNGSGSGTTAAAPWHRPSIYLFNPFGKSFHGYISHSETHQLLAKDGQYLVRKRIKDNDDDFVLSFRFNGHIKNFIITFDDTSGLIYVGDREKGYASLEELVQEGLITIYLDHKAGPYIELMCDLTRYNNRSNHGHHHNHLGYNHHLQRIGEVVDGGGQRDFSRNGSSHYANRGGGHHLYTMSPSSRQWNGSSGKQNSPSPSVSSLSRSSMERQRNPDLKTHSFEIHTFQDLFKCQICQNFLWGLSSQGLLCKDCGFIIHELCLERVSTECEPRLSQLPSIFGSELTVLVKATGGCKAPFVLEKCIREIEARGLHIEGIYRVSGSRELTERLKNLLEQEREGADLSKHADIHSMCGLVKLFLRQLPQPLITKEVFQRFLNASANGPLSLEIVRRDLKKLPPANYITLKYLLQHLHRVAERSDRNKMNPFNLSSVFAPSVLCPSQISMETLKTGTAALELMITQVRNLYPKSS